MIAKPTLQAYLFRASIGLDASMRTAHFVLSNKFSSPGKERLMTDLYKSDIAPSGNAPEIIYVRERRIACNGGGGALGHPMVYYSLDDGDAECGYCDRKFIYDPARATD